MAPDSLNPDPDPAFQVNPDPVKKAPDTIYGPRILININWEKIQLNCFFFISKIAICLSLGLHKGLPSYKRLLEPSKKNIQHFKR